MFYIGKEDGTVDAWDLLDRFVAFGRVTVKILIGIHSSCNAAMSQSVCSPESITVIEAFEVNTG